MNARTARLPAAATVLIALAAAAWQWLSVPPALDDTLLADCLGSRLPMTVARQMPYVAVRVNGSPARFVVDFGADVSAITPTGFEASPPSPSPGTADRYRQFEFFGPWHNVRLLPQPVAPVAGDLRAIVSSIQIVADVDRMGAPAVRALRPAVRFVSFQ